MTLEALKIIDIKAFLYPISLTSTKLLVLKFTFGYGITHFLNTHRVSTE